MTVRIALTLKNDFNDSPSRWKVYGAFVIPKHITVNWYTWPFQIKLRYFVCSGFMGTW